MPSTSESLFRNRAVKILGFPGGSDGKESACNAGDLGLISGLGRSPGVGLRYWGSGWGRHVNPRPFHFNV